MGNRKKASEIICRQLFDSFHALPGFNGVFLSYMAHDDEIDLTDFHENMRTFSEMIYFPTIRDCSLRFDLAWDRTITYQPSEKAILILPGEAFCETGERQAADNGEYIRFLKEHTNVIYKVGVCSDKSLKKSIEPVAQNLTVDVIITEKRSIRLGSL